MKRRIVYTTNNSTGYFEIDENITSIRVPRGITVLMDEGPEEPLLPPGQVGPIEGINPGQPGDVEAPLLPPSI